MFLRLWSLQNPVAPSEESESESNSDDESTSSSCSSSQPQKRPRAQWYIQGTWFEIAIDIVQK